MNLPRAFCCWACNSKNLAASRSVSMLMSVDFVWFFLRQLLKKKKKDWRQRSEAPRYYSGRGSQSGAGKRVTGYPLCRNSATHGGELLTRWRSKVVETNEVCESLSEWNRPPRDTLPPGEPGSCCQNTVGGIRTGQTCWNLWRAVVFKTYLSGFCLGFFVCNKTMLVFLRYKGRTPCKANNYSLFWNVILKIPLMGYFVFLNLG